MKAAAAHDVGPIDHGGGRRPATFSSPPHIRCLRRLEMSRWLPDRNVWAGRLGSGGGKDPRGAVGWMT